MNEFNRRSTDHPEKSFWFRWLRSFPSSWRLRIRSAAIVGTTVGAFVIITVPPFVNWVKDLNRQTEIKLAVEAGPLKEQIRILSENQKALQRQIDEMPDTLNLALMREQLRQIDHGVRGVHRMIENYDEINGGRFENVFKRFDELQQKKGRW